MPVSNKEWSKFQKGFRASTGAPEKEEEEKENEEEGPLGRAARLLFEKVKASKILGGKGK